MVDDGGAGELDAGAGCVAVGAAACAFAAEVEFFGARAFDGAAEVDVTAGDDAGAGAGAEARAGCDAGGRTGKSLLAAGFLSPLAPVPVSVISIDSTASRRIIAKPYAVFTLNEFSSNPTIVPKIFVPSFSRNSSARTRAAVSARATMPTRIQQIRLIYASIARAAAPGKRSGRSGAVVGTRWTRTVSRSGGNFSSACRMNPFSPERQVASARSKKDSANRLAAPGAKLGENTEANPEGYGHNRGDNQEGADSFSSRSGNDNSHRAKREAHLKPEPCANAIPEKSEGILIPHRCERRRRRKRCGDESRESQSARPFRRRPAQPNIAPVQRGLADDHSDDQQNQ